MTASTLPEPRSSCPIAASLDVLGDRWTLIVLRDMLLQGRTHFVDLAEQESIATNTLSDRLHRLREAGVIARVPDPEDGRRWIYAPRQPAVDLIPVLVDLMLWGDAHTAGEAPDGMVDAARDRDALIGRIALAAHARVVAD